MVYNIGQLNFENDTCFNVTLNLNFVHFDLISYPLINKSDFCHYLNIFY
jgi:hypothetical protein